MYIRLVTSQTSAVIRKSTANGMLKARKVTAVMTERTVKTERMVKTAPKARKVTKARMVPKMEKEKRRQRR